MLSYYLFLTPSPIHRIRQVLHGERIRAQLSLKQLLMSLIIIIIIIIIAMTTRHHNLQQAWLSRVEEEEVKEQTLKTDYPPNVSTGGDAGAVGGDSVDATMLNVNVNPLIVNHRRSVITTSVAGANGSGAAGDNADLILRSLRPQIRHKRSYTHLMNLGGKGMFRSDDVPELEKVTTGLETPTTHDDGDQRKGKGKAKATTGEGNNEGDVDVNINKTLPVPPPATKPVNINL
ncbi:hypothetical protein NP233_g12862 [Leucocoprinus birnbaumii]|uniref:Uncharacterized protein n=1 Tax=Leucocoprinus birnbaumii TaxID=56174 RepID=A0AAD5VDZ1_9AGAR|nr:hypothetical protein NP233_g12862 [Leucocoprinus birnbaumii]